MERKNIVSNQSPIILNGLRNLMDMNPDWSVIISDDHDVEAYLKEKLEMRDYDLIRDRHIVEKIDLWRLLKIYYEGGLYIDIDRYYNISLNNILSEDTTCLLPTYLDVDFSQDFMMSSPGNPIFKEAIRLNLERRSAGWNNIYFWGPQTFMHAVTSLLVGKIIDSNPGPETFSEIRSKIAEFPFIKTYRENPPFDTIVFKYDEKSWKTGNNKNREEFYRKFDVHHWTEKSNTEL